MYLGSKSAAYCIPWLMMFGKQASKDKVELAKDMIEEECEQICILTDMYSLTEWVFDHHDIVPGKSIGTCRPIPEYQ